MSNKINEIRCWQNLSPNRVPKRKRTSRSLYVGKLILFALIKSAHFLKKKINTIIEFNGNKIAFEQVCANSISQCAIFHHGK